MPSAPRTASGPRCSTDFFWFGPSTAGTIYSFGFTLLTSVLLNFVFGVWATRVIDPRCCQLSSRLRKAWLFGGRKDGGADFKTPSINFIGNRKKFYTFSCALLALVLVFCGVFGVKMDVEFKGGSMITLAYEGDADLNDLKSTISTELNKSNLTLQTGSDISGNQTLTVTLPGSDTLTTEELDSLLATLNEQYPDNAFVQNEVSNVDATIGKEFMLKSIVALVAACVLILLYVAYRFRRIGGLKAGSTAIVALLHDMLVVFGVFVILRIPLNGNFIAALLTILGYSINDTVVIYDRIRENTGLYGKKMSLPELVNLSINQSFWPFHDDQYHHLHCTGNRLRGVHHLQAGQHLHPLRCRCCLVWSAVFTAPCVLQPSCGSAIRPTRLPPAPQESVNQEELCYALPVLRCR